MFKIKNNFLLLTILSLTSGLASAKFADYPGDNTITVDGLTRHFLINIPANLPAGGAPVVISYHGTGGTPQEEANDDGLVKYSNQYGFVLVYPRGLVDANRDNANAWQCGYKCDNGWKSGGVLVNDVNFTKALLDTIENNLTIDQASIFCTGISNGADMCYYLLEQPHPIMAAIAPVCGCVQQSAVANFTPPPVSILEIHGTADPITPWKGDLKDAFYGAYLGTEEMLKVFTKGLALDKETSEILAQNEGDASQVILYRWSSESDQTEVRLYKRVGGLHEWPASLGGKPTDLVIWNFFQSHRPQG